MKKMLVLLFAMCMGVVWAQDKVDNQQQAKDFNSGLVAYKKREYVSAAKYFQQAAEKEHAQAQFWLGQCYNYGQGVTKDYPMAILWYNRASKLGSADAQNALGNCYYNGEGVTQDYNQAIQWYRKAADRGHVLGQINLGTCYKNGHGVAASRTEATKWFRKAAAQNDPMAVLAKGLLEQMQ